MAVVGTQLAAAAAMTQSAIARFEAGGIPKPRASSVQIERVEPGLTVTDKRWIISEADHPPVGQTRRVPLCHDMCTCMWPCGCTIARGC